MNESPNLLRSHGHKRHDVCLSQSCRPLVDIATHRRVALARIQQIHGVLLLAGATLIAALLLIPFVQHGLGPGYRIGWAFSGCLAAKGAWNCFFGWRAYGKASIEQAKIILSTHIFINKP